MKTFIKTLGLATAFAFALVAGPVRAQDDTAAPAPANPADNSAGDSSVNFQTFYDQLASQGSWVQTDKYGYVFQPTESNPDWRPYTYGHWVNTDAGLTWVSDDSFGWATDHYGRWVNLDGTGWVWVPGYTWGPAWVSWRDSDDGDDVGWAPLPPDSDVGIDYYGDNDLDLGFGGWFGFHIGDDCDTAYGIGPGWYNFCPVAYIGDSDCWRHFRDRRDNFAYIGHTRNVTNINFNRNGAGRFGRVHAEGPSVAALNARAHTPIRNVSLASVSSRDAAGLRGNTLAVYAPRVNRSTVANARPADVSRSLTNTTVNRGTNIADPLAVNSTLRPASATAGQIHAAKEAHYSSGARVATASTHFLRALNQPLSSMRADTRSVTSTAHNSRFTGAGAQPNRTEQPAAESRYTGESEHPTASSSGEDRFTGEPATRHEDNAPVADRGYTGEPAMRHEDNPSVADRNFTGEPAQAEHREAHVDRTPSYAGGEAYHPSSVYHTSAAPVYHPQGSSPVFHTSTPAYHREASAPSFHPSAPSYHPQASYHPSYHAATPAVHASGGGFHPSGGGGGFHPAAHAGGGGGNHSGGNGGRH